MEYNMIKNMSLSVCVSVNLMLSDLELSTLTFQFTKSLHCVAIRIMFFAYSFQSPYEVCSNCRVYLFYNVLW